MIFPFLKGFISFKYAPITWVIVALNTMVFMWSWSAQLRTSYHLDELMSEEYFVETQGRIYTHYLSEHFSIAPDIVRELASTGEADAHHFRLLGHLAFRDDTFLREAPADNLLADEVALSHWKKQISQIRDLQSIHPSFLLGISTDATNLRQWLTYIFTHSSGMHFFGNMLFFVIFGGALETLIGGLGLLVIFLTTGVFAGGFFLYLCGPSTAPLIGASGAISGVMAMYCVLRWNAPIKYIYWFFLPTREAIGFVYLPAWTMAAIWLLGDLAGYFGNIEILGGVAHAAHLGGELSGALAGLLLLAMRKGAPVVPATIEPPMWQLYPFFHLHQLIKTKP
jgi:membrane associated rhomboid family serine protease